MAVLQQVTCVNAFEILFSTMVRHRWAFILVYNIHFNLQPISTQIHKFTRKDNLISIHTEVGSEWPKVSKKYSKKWICSKKYSKKLNFTQKSTQKRRKSLKKVNFTQKSTQKSKFTQKSAQKSKFTQKSYSKKVALKVNSLKKVLKQLLKK